MHKFSLYFLGRSAVMAGLWSFMQIDIFINANRRVEYRSRGLSELRNIITRVFRNATLCTSLDFCHDWKYT